MAKTAAVMIGISVIAIGLGVPAVCLYASLYYGFNYVAAAITAIAGIIVAGGFGIVGIVMGPLGQVFEGPSRAEREKIRSLRAHQRATLEELDGIITILGEIRDVLRIVEE